MMDNEYRTYNDKLRRAIKAEDAEDIWFDIPSKFIDEDMCKLAVSKSGMMLGWVPSKFATRRVCKAALVQSVASWGYLPTEMKRDTDLIRLAVRNGLPLDWVYPEDRTDALEAIAKTTEVKLLSSKLSDWELGL
jgi:hypothetical protein